VAERAAALNLQLLGLPPLLVEDGADVEHRDLLGDREGEDADGEDAEAQVERLQVA
jgi:hypothetical protein